MILATYHESLPPGLTCFLLALGFIIGLMVGCFVTAAATHNLIENERRKHMEEIEIIMTRRHHPKRP